MDLLERERIAMEHCASEPIHTPSQIQSEGAMIVLDDDFQKITHVSSNIEKFLGKEPSELLGKRPTDLFDGPFNHSVRNSLNHPSLHVRSEFLGVYELFGKLLSVSVCLGDDQTILELERARHTGPGIAPMSRVQSMLFRIKSADETPDLLRAATKVMRLALACDRVMIYRFLASGDGEVVAESKWKHVKSYLGLRYPATDIPQQARDLFFKTPLRINFDVTTPPIPILALNDTQPLVDMTASTLRGVSPVHVQYLQNMGVKASMVIPLIINNTLWGLIACHSESFPMEASPQNRAICALFGQMFSSLLWQRLERDLLKKRSALPDIRYAMRSLHQRPNSQKIFEELNKALGDAIAHDGMAFCNNGQWISDGSCLNTHAADALLEYSQAMDSKPVHAFDSLQEILPSNALGQVAGALVLHLNNNPSVSFILFRDEIESKVRWAGNARKSIEDTPDGPRLLPRASFQEYIESVLGCCESWSIGDLQLATELRGLLLEYMLRQEWIDNRRKEVLVHELNHRVKNIFALVRSLARQTKKSAQSVDEFTDIFESRLTALSIAHDQATSFGNNGADISTLLHTELSPFLSDSERVSLSGPEVTLRPEAAPMIALLFHELTTNAVKHGSLSVPEGALSISWQCSRGGLVDLVWTEHQGPQVTPPTHRGMGLDLLQKSIPYEFGGSVRLDFLPEGLCATIQLPMIATDSSQPENIIQHTLSDEDDLPHLDMTQHSVLVVEDNLLLAMDTTELLTSMRCENIDTAPTNQRSLSLLEHSNYSVALLDINLRDGESFATARMLRKRSTPFCFVSGDTSAQHLPEDLQSIPVLAKPLQPLALRRTLSALLNTTR